MKWEEVEPKQDYWKQQYNLTAYYGEHIVGSLVLDSDGDWESVIDDTVKFMDCSNLEEAKEEFYGRMELFLEGEINYYTELSEMLDEIRRVADDET